MPQCRQMLHHQLPALPMIGGDGAVGRGWAVDDSERPADVDDAGAEPRNDDDAVHVALDEPVDRFRLHRDAAAGVGDQHAVAGGTCGIFDRLGDLREKRVRDVRQHQTEHPGVPRAERAGGGARDIAQLVRFRPDPVDQLSGDPALARKRVRHRRRRDVERGGDHGESRAWARIGQETVAR